MYFDAIAKIVSERTGCDVAAVKPESKFSELGIDSLDTVELLMNLEDEIGIEIAGSRSNWIRRWRPLTIWISSSRARRVNAYDQISNLRDAGDRISGVSGRYGLDR